MAFQQAEKMMRMLQFTPFAEERFDVNFTGAAVPHRDGTQTLTFALIGILKVGYQSIELFRVARVRKGEFMNGDTVFAIELNAPAHTAFSWPSRFQRKRKCPPAWRDTQIDIVTDEHRAGVRGTIFRVDAVPLHHGMCVARDGPDRSQRAQRCEQIVPAGRQPDRAQANTGSNQLSFTDAERLSNIAGEPLGTSGD
ncbi:MAG: hypothetical protein WDO18_20730 [Acidobacteriota bacterium]